MRWSLLLVLLVVGGIPVRAENGMVRRSFQDGRISLLIPAEFRQLPKEIVAQKYGARNASWVVYGTPTSSATVTARILTNPFSNSKVDEAALKLEILWKDRRPRILWHNHGLQLIGDRVFALFDIDSQASDGRVYSVMALATTRGRLVLVTFNMTSATRQKWLPLARRSVKSIVLRD